MRIVLAIVTCGLAVAACAGGGATPATPAPATPATTVPVTQSPQSAEPSVAARACPNPEVGSGNDCLGPVAAGSYTTTRFSPTLTYTVPGGWANLEDMAGNFLLLPPGSQLGGVNTGTSDYLGVYSSVVAPGHCTGRYDPDVKRTFDGLLGWLQADPALSVTNLHDVTVGGLDGVVMDIALEDPRGDGCPDGTYADVYVGAGPTSLVHAVDRDYPLRVYLLHDEDRTLAVELADAPDGGSDYPDWFASAEPIVQELVFTPG